MNIFFSARRVKLSGLFRLFFLFYDIKRLMKKLPFVNTLAAVTDNSPTEKLVWSTSGDLH